MSESIDVMACRLCGVESDQNKTLKSDLMNKIQTAYSIMVRRLDKESYALQD